MRPSILRWPAWNNGQHSRSGSGYGVKVPIEDRAAYFNRSWKTVTLVLPLEDGSREVQLNVAKASFWSDVCRELISAEIGKWLIARGLAPWPDRKPPKMEVVPEGPSRFAVKRAVAG